MAELKSPSFILWVDYKIILKSQLSILNSFLRFKPSLSMTSIYKVMDFIGKSVKRQYGFINYITIFNDYIVIKMISIIIKMVFLLIKMISITIKMIFLLIKMISITIKMVFLSIKMISITIKMIFLLIKMIFIIIKVSYMVILAIKPYWVFALFTAKTVLSTLKNKQMERSKIRFCDVRHIFMPSEQILKLIKINRDNTPETGIHHRQ